MKTFKLILLLLVISFFFDTSTYATELSDWHILEVNEASVDVMHLTHSDEPFLAPTYNPQNKLDLHLNLGIVNNILFLDNTIHSETDIYQFRLIGWQYRFGLHIGQSVDLFMEHQSLHLLDTIPSSANSYDGIGIKVYFYRK